jgi:hypothetical protein
MKRIFILIIIIVTVTGIIYTAANYRLSDRNTIKAIESFVVKDTVAVGTGEYGYITHMHKRVGANVIEGDQLYSYLPLREVDQEVSYLLPSVVNPAFHLLNNEEKNEVLYTVIEDDSLIKHVLSPVEGILRTIFLPRGSYVTRDDKVLEIQLDSFLIRSKLNVSPQDIHLVQTNAPVIIELPNGQKVRGYIAYIHPEYDFENEEIIVDSAIDEPIDFLYDGTPVSVVLEKDDDLYIRFTEFQESIINGINNFFNNKQD